MFIKRLFRYKYKATWSRCLIAKQTRRFSAVNLLIDGRVINNTKFIANDPFKALCLCVLLA